MFVVRDEFNRIIETFETDKEAVECAIDISSNHSYASLWLNDYLLSEFKYGIEFEKR